MIIMFYCFALSLNALCAVINLCSIFTAYSVSGVVAFAALAAFNMLGTYVCVRGIIDNAPDSYYPDDES